MASFQFYKKDKILVHLDVHSPSFTTENEQLIDQGFELIGDIIDAENSQVAHETFKSIHGDELRVLAKSQMWIGIATAGAGGLSI